VCEQVTAWMSLVGYLPRPVALPLFGIPAAACIVASLTHLLLPQKILPLYEKRNHPPLEGWPTGIRRRWPDFSQQATRVLGILVLALSSIPAVLALLPSRPTDLPSC
jgi:hypothetical protein